MAKKTGPASDRVYLQNAIKTLATNIRFASVDHPIHSVVVTSSVPNEGKSTISISLAQAMAQGGKEVLIVECDMRRRSVAAMIGAHARNGIYSVLTGQVELEDAVVRTATSGMYFLDCEPHIPNPVDILASKRFRNFANTLTQRYDFVVFDTPPLSAFIDAAVASEVADGTLLVVRQNFVKRDELLAAYDQLKKADANVIGAVMNYCDTEKSEYYYSYYTKDGKKAPAADFSEPAPTDNAAAPAPKPAPRVAQQGNRAAATSSSAAPGLKPLPTNGAAASRRVSPESTAQFLAGTSYRPRTYTDE